MRDFTHNTTAIFGGSYCHAGEKRISEVHFFPMNQDSKMRGKVAVSPGHHRYFRLTGWRTHNVDPEKSEELLCKNQTDQQE